MKNKFSRYNYLFRKEKQGILYNISSDGIMVLSPELDVYKRQHCDD